MEQKAALSWAEEGDDTETATQGLRILVLKNMFDQNELKGAEHDRAF
jgi:hypothetical protein